MPESLKPLVPCEKPSSSSSSSASAANGWTPADRKTSSSSRLISSSLLTTSLRPAKCNGVCPRPRCRRPSVGNVLDVSDRSSREVGSNASSSESESEKRSRLMLFDSVLIPLDGAADGPKYVDTANHANPIDSIELLQKAVVKNRKDSTRW